MGERKKEREGNRRKNLGYGIERRDVRIGIWKVEREGETKKKEISRGGER
ncbi:hypothetical protein HDL76_01770 [Bordetella pertussis]|nr:hypothetical protein HDL76_01770 [Bordetella pertussis]